MIVESARPTMPAPMPELNGVLADINGLHSLAAEAGSALYEFLARVSGPQAEEGEGDAVCRGGAGTLGDIKRSIDCTRGALLKILEMARTIQSIG